MTYEELLADGKIDDAVVAYVERNQHVSYPELIRLLGPYMRVEGDMVTGPREFGEVVFWVGMSEEFVDLISRLTLAGRIHGHPAHLLEYMIDGGLLRIPIAKAARFYKKPHWFPIVFCTYQLGEGGRKRRVEKMPHCVGLFVLG